MISESSNTAVMIYILISSSEVFVTTQSYHANSIKCISHKYPLQVYMNTDFFQHGHHCSEVTQSYRCKAVTVTGVCVEKIRVCLCFLIAL